MITHYQPHKLMLTSPRLNLRVKQIVRMKTPNDILLTFENSSNTVIRTSISELSGLMVPKHGNHKKMLDQTWLKNIFRNTLKRTPPKTLIPALYGYILLHIHFTVLYNRSEKAVLHQSVV